MFGSAVSSYFPSVHLEQNQHCLATQRDSHASICRLVDGFDLRHALSFKSNFCGGGEEASMLNIAVQLLEVSLLSVCATC